MKVQDAVSNVCQRVHDFSVLFATWGTKFVTDVTTKGAEFAKKALELAKPYFETTKNFVGSNKAYVAVAGFAAATGALLFSAFSRYYAPATSKP